jgi:hypothetical protein
MSFGGTSKTVAENPEAEVPERVLRAQLGPPTAKEDGDCISFLNEGAATDWVDRNASRIESLRLYSFKDGSVSVEFTYNTSMLFQRDSIRGSEKMALHKNLTKGAF